MEKKLIVEGTADLRVRFKVALDMTEEQFTSMEWDAQDKEIEHSVDWQKVGRNAEVCGIEVDDWREEKTNE